MKIKSELQDFHTQEIMRATSFFFEQFNKGYTPQEAFAQVENSYSWMIRQCVEHAIANNLNEVQS